MNKSESMLKEAFAGESQANQKYRAFAKKAMEEGHLKIARLFRAAAEAETIHAQAHQRIFREANDTIENIKASIVGETHEYKNMYPEMIVTAISEKNKKAERSFRYAKEAEEVHATLYQKALDNFNKDENQDIFYWVCPVCGYITEEKYPENCLICGTDGKKFIKID